MLQLILQKIKNKKGLVFSLLLGNILLISIVCCNVIYTRASLQRMINTTFSDYLEQQNTYPMLVSVQSGLSQIPSGVGNQKAYFRSREVANLVEDEYEIPLKMKIRHDQITVVHLDMDNYRGKSQSQITLKLGAITDLPRHVVLREGTYPSSEFTEDGYAEVMMCQRMMITQCLVVGDTFTSTKLTDENGELLKLRIVGVFDADETIDDGYWVQTPSAYFQEFIMEESLFSRLFVSDEPQIAIRTFYQLLFDYGRVKPEDVERIIDVSQKYNEEFKSYSDTEYREKFSERLAVYLSDARKVRITLWVLQVPVFILLGVFIFMVAKQMLEMEQSEISIMKSRGASKKQIIQVYLLQSTMTAVAGWVIGIPLAFFLCQVIGSANAFLEFVSRKALPVELTLDVLLAGILAALFSIAVMVVPVLKYSNVTIVAQKQRKTRGNGAPWWQRYFVDVLLLAVSLYGLYSFSGQKDALAAAVADGASLDPLLFLSSSLFIMGAGLVSLRIVPMISWAVYRIGRKHWSPALYTSFLRIIRTRYRQSFIMIFLIVTVALGIFNAKAARTINRNEELRLHYLTGADVVLKEKWQDNSASLEDGGELTYIEPDFDKYLTMDHVVSGTKVYRDLKSTVTTNNLKNVQLMGIHTREFGETAFMDTSLLPEYWFNYLNLMSEDSGNLIVSSNFRENFGYKVGDDLMFKSGPGGSTWGKIVAFVDYWPGYNPYSYTRREDGLYSQTEKYLIVAHLSRLQSMDGILPYEVWLRTDGTTSGVYEGIEQKKITLTSFTDVADSVIRLKNNAVFQGTNGILTVGFIVVLMQSRALQFGIFRAMGMSLKEILAGLINEQVFITGFSMLIGGVVGVIASHLYVPLIQISYASYDQPLPLRIASAGSDSLKLFLLIGIAIALCLVILGWIISRIHISQALKLGED